MEERKQAWVVIEKERVVGSSLALPRRTVLEKERVEATPQQQQQQQQEAALIRAQLSRRLLLPPQRLT
jgi:hypothetical protein